MKQINLNCAILGQYKLTEKDIDNLVQVLTYRCSSKTKFVIRTALTFIHEEKPCNIYEGVIKNPKTGLWQYIASQSYTTELRTIRELLRGW